MKKILLSLSLITLALSGCATVFSGTTQTIHVRVVELPSNALLENVTCKAIDGNGGTYAVIGNPASVTVSKGNGAITIVCKKEGYNQLNTAVGDSFNALTLVNAIFWPGFIVDAVTGSYKKYPSHYEITMEKK